ncbi:glutamate receptor ionotropic, kainate 2-like isoform X4 [Adelges cooleyi]|uniref:glutamate receptor ionotropic, kainate 2-like isoform X4 n=1 Tax=Adelges cooleyi TaxID=133065 RepID=UPI0021805EC5|nr:glutamate receptor ionotropic, kainate 2-like isoform X4 [Adelges cooleyi]
MIVSYNTVIVLILLTVYNSNCQENSVQTDDDGIANPPIVHKNTVKIVAVFHEDDDTINRLAYDVSARTINIMDTVLPKTNIVPRSQYVMYDVHNVTKTVCDSMSPGIASFVGGTYEEYVENIIRSISTHAQIPFIETHWKTSPRPADPYTVNVYPDPSLLAKAIRDIILDMDWTSFTVIYDRPTSMIRLKALLESFDYGNFSPTRAVKFKQILPTEDFRPLFKELKQSNEKHIILDYDTDNIIDVLAQAKEVEFMGDYQSYVITNLDAHTLNFEDFRSVKSNITLIRLVDPENPHVVNAVNEIVFNEQKKGRLSRLTPNTMKTETALMYDAVNLFATSLHGLVATQSMKSQQISCRRIQPWMHGFSLINYMRVVELDGLTGKMRFDNVTGNRNFFKLDVVKVHDNTMQRLGSWDPERGMSYTRTASEIYSDIVQSITNKTFVVVGRIGEPYLMKCNGTTENELDVSDRCFEGFTYDLISEMASYNRFKFKFITNGEYGSLQKNGKWNGMMGDLQSMKADLAICDLTINFDRSRVVDFTTPFMTLGISILYAKPEKKKPQLFWFLNPLSFSVWMYTATAYLGVSLFLFMLARITPNEWHDPQPWKNGNNELETKLNVANLIWFSCGTMLQQGSDISPQAVSTRLVAGMWWLFALIMTSSYTANLAASITSGRLDTPIKNVEDLSKESDIQYGCYREGSTAGFFQKSNLSLYQRMWSVMESSNPTVFTKSNDEGVDRVLKGNGRYAFLMESATIEYQTERHCNLMQIGNTLDSKGYGIAMPMNSPYRTIISESVLRMQESGFLRELKDKWWKVQGHNKCEEEVESDELGLPKIGGVFVVLILGCLIAFLISILEFLWNIRKVAIEEGITPREALILEWKFAMECNGVVKPLRRRHNSSEYEITNSNTTIHQ